MSDTNVGLGMVACRKNCRCADCQIEALRARVVELEQTLESFPVPSSGDPIYLAARRIDAWIVTRNKVLGKSDVPTP